MKQKAKDKIMPNLSVLKNKFFSVIMNNAKITIIIGIILIAIIVSACTGSSKIRKYKWKFK